MTIVVKKPIDLVGVVSMTTIMNYYGAAGVGLRTGFAYHDPALEPALFASVSLFTVTMQWEGFFTGNFPMKFYTPAQAFPLGASGILAILLAEGFTAGNFNAGTIVHAAGDTDATILAALRNDGYTSGSGQFINGAVDLPNLVLSAVAAGTALALTTGYVDIPGATLTLNVPKNGYIMVWAKAPFDENGCNNAEALSVQLLVNGSAQSYVISQSAVYSNTWHTSREREGYYRIPVTVNTIYTIKLQAKNATAAHGGIAAGAQIMAWWVQS